MGFATTRLSVTPETADGAALEHWKSSGSMSRLTKKARRAVKHALHACGNAILAVTPNSVRERAAPAARYLDMILLDHLFIRTVFPNRHRLSKEAWRGAQPLPHQFGRLTRKGIRTIVNLRGNAATSTYEFEKAACARAGITLVDFRIRSRDVPTREELRAARELFGRLDYPILMHCKSGADRVGLMSALYKHIRCGVPISEAKRELSLRYGHIRQADTGVLDYFFERYLEDNAKNPMPFFDWVETVYDPKELKRSFHAEGWANRIVDSILRRE
jgi:protein tyrosine/serine phosphatase